MFWHLLEVLIALQVLASPSATTYAGVVTPLRIEERETAKQIFKRQSWTPWAFQNTYDSAYGVSYDYRGWPAYQRPYYDSYYLNYYYGPSIRPLLNQPQQHYDSPMSSYNPCADPDSVNWRVNCNGGGYQKTTNVDGGLRSSQETATFFTWQYGSKKNFDQPFRSLGNENLNGQFGGSDRNISSDSGSVGDNGSSVSGSVGGSGSSVSGNSVSGNPDSGSGSGSKDCTNGVDSKNTCVASDAPANASVLLGTTPSLSVSL
ncbi:hypothetical protein CKM354_000785700 [Cercospora kikuchii]|uniref:Secreted protein n=1 Tax=Cercospora kikuchii TaxID=84275 RepID=A0A9P3CL10_9PEZI|nr:uncharacterized protein CKM354_000785700 [Cercospora kikuchii]GIZ44666.1 hypothetical protein CKM354_000785700 [Cercospora kikuchii]